MSSELDIYTTLEEAREEVYKRWNNEALRKEVKAFVGEIPEPLRNEPRAWLGRYIATPDNEFFHFLKLAKQCNLKPLATEYLEDRFYRKNDDKICLAKMQFIHGKNRAGGSQNVHLLKIINDRKNHMRNFADIQTLWGEPFITFHHRLLALYAPAIEVLDASAWFHSYGNTAKDYYSYLLALFVAHGVLFEDFVTDGSEARFTKEIMLPAFEKVQASFGLKPLIVSLVPDLADEYWWCYPEYIEAEVAKCLKNIN